MDYVLIGLGGILGANARYLVASWATRQFGLEFPYGTFLINLSGSFVIGLIMALLARYPAHSHFRLFFVVGFLGAYTTFSTFSFEALQLLQSERPWLAFFYVAGSATLGILCAWLGFRLGH